jgi:N-acetylmuramoyl-L-alanine amidase
MNLHVLMATKNYYYKVARKYRPRGFIVHSTGANNPTLRRYVGPDDGILGVNPYRNYYNRPDIYAVPHGVTGLTQYGDVASYQILPADVQCSHSHNGWDDYYIGWETAEDDLSDPVYCRAVFFETAEVAARWAKLYGFGSADCISHAEYARKTGLSDHRDPEHWWSRHGLTMDMWRAEISRILGEAPAPEPEPEPCITIGSRVLLTQDAYWPGGPTVSERARDGVHTVSSLTYAGKPVTKGGEKCVLLGDIATWAAVSNLKLEGVVAPEPEPTPIAPTPPGIEAGSRVRIKAKTYWPGGPTVPLWVRAVTHVVTRTSYNGKTVEKGGKPCVLLGRKVNLFGTEVSGINTWVATENLEAANG